MGKFSNTTKLHEVVGRVHFVVLKNFEVLICTKLHEKLLLDNLHENNITKR